MKKLDIDLEKALK